MPTPPPADERTPYQDPRDFFAAERTFLSWIRTGLAMMGFGFVVARFGLFLREIAAGQGLQAPTPGWSRWFGVGLMALGVVLNAMAALSHIATVDRLKRGEPFVGRPSWMGVGLAVVLATSGAVMVIYLMTYA